MLLWNARSLKEKMNELEQKVNQLKPEVIGITETWYNEKQKHHRQLKGYKSININRRNKKGGGIIAFIKSNISFAQIAIDKYDHGKLEYLYLKIASKDEFNVFIVYFPNGNLSSSL